MYATTGLQYFHGTALLHQDIVGVFCVIQHFVLEYYAVDALDVGIYDQASQHL